MKVIYQYPTGCWLGGGGGFLTNIQLLGWVGGEKGVPNQYPTDYWFGWWEWGILQVFNWLLVWWRGEVIYQYPSGCWLGGGFPTNIQLVSG